MTIYDDEYDDGSNYLADDNMFIDFSQSIQEIIKDIVRHTLMQKSVFDLVKQRIEYYINDTIKNSLDDKIESEIISQVAHTIIRDEYIKDKIDIILSNKIKQQLILQKPELKDD
jgi:hypothetical protein